MGLSIHYSSAIKNYQDVEPKVEEVKTICQELNWKYHLFDDSLVKGISF